MYSKRVFVGILFVIIAHLATLIVSQSVTNSTTVAPTTSQNSTKVASLSIPGTNKSISLSVTKKTSEEDCEDDEPVPEAEGKTNASDNRQGKELNLTDKEKYTHGNATAEPEPESEPGKNGTSVAGTKDKLTSGNGTASTTMSPHSGAGVSGSSCFVVGVATLSTMLMKTSL